MTARFIIPVNADPPEGIDLPILIALCQRVIQGFDGTREIFRLGELFRCDAIPSQEQLGVPFLEVPSGLAPNMLFDRLSGEGKSFPDALDSWGTPEFKLFSIREHRNALLRLCDPLFLRHQSQLLLGASTTLTNEEFLTLLSYMQSLRDFPANVDLNNITWPTKPSFMQPINAAITPPAA